MTIHIRIVDECTYVYNYFEDQKKMMIFSKSIFCLLFHEFIFMNYCIFLFLIYFEHVK